jgi:hypothetical protein
MRMTACLVLVLLLVSFPRPGKRLQKPSPYRAGFGLAGMALQIRK